jgi:4a-hydroxytetrahydrobiopterin dehydratase
MPKKLSNQEISTRLKGIPGWKRKGQEISRLYVFSGCIAAMVFVHHVADLAERMDHHPDFLIQSKQVKLTLSTHDAGGLTVLDFELAKKIDA